ncbi:MAG: hypothetical protein WCD50_13840 [Onishia taeanensis]|uniref:hypothetical protein n=1 Tax=Onishia taeanensis TaxID=284577 RepID=UPI003C7BDD32
MTHDSIPFDVEADTAAGKDISSILSEKGANIDSAQDRKAHRPACDNTPRHQRQRHGLNGYRRK